MFGRPLIIGLFAFLGFLTCFLCVLNAYFWGPDFPLWLILLDVVLGLVIVTGSVWAYAYYERHKKVLTDEFSVAKKREAGATGAFIGAIIYVLMSLAFAFIPGLDDVFVGSHIQGSAFAIGRLVGFLPFLAGIGLGHLFTWIKYR